MSKKKTPTIPQNETPPVPQLGIHNYLNVALDGRRVRAGDVIAVQVEGGWIRVPAPCEGMMYILPDKHEIFVPSRVSLAVR